MKNVQNCTQSSSDWKIVSRVTETIEHSTSTDLNQKIFLIYVRDGTGNNIVAHEAYGENHKNIIIKSLLNEYGNYIDKVEHEE